MGPAISLSTKSSRHRKRVLQRERSDDESFPAAQTSLSALRPLLNNGEALHIDKSFEIYYS